MNRDRCVVGMRVSFSSPCGTEVNEPAVITRVYGFGMIEVDLDNGHHWLTNPEFVHRPMSDILSG